MKVEKIDHLCFAVKDLDAARANYESVLGFKLDTLYTAESEKIRVARYYVGEVAIELMEATGPDSEVAKFIERQGEGFFLISYRVPDVDDALAELKEKRMKTIDEEPRKLMGNRYAFINYPNELNGILTEVLDGDFDPENE